MLIKIDAEIADYGVQDDMAYITVQVSSDNVTEGFPGHRGGSICGGSG